MPFTPSRRRAAVAAALVPALLVTVAATPAAAAPAVIAGAPDCPRGWFCFYDYANYGYPRGKLSDCGAQDLGTWYWRNRTDSVQNNSSVVVRFYNGTIGSGQLLFTVYPGYAMSTVSPNQNRADYVVAC